MSKISKTKSDYIYSLAYQVFNLLFPIFLTPYTARALGATSIGIYTYLGTIISYFAMFAKLGVDNLGSRKIAKNRENKTKLSKAFFSVYIIQFVMSFLMTTFYIIFSLLFLKDNISVALIRGISLFATIFDVWWVFSGLEKFKINILKNTIIRIITFILIIIFVKNSTDLWKYALILSLSDLILNLLWLGFLKKEIKFVKLSFKEVRKEIKPSILLFLPNLARSVYQSFDKIMLGNMICMTEVGLYEQGYKLTKIPLTLIYALSSIMLPKSSNLLSKNKMNELKKNIETSLNFITFAIIPMCFGLIAIADKLIPLMMGKEFIKSASVLKLLSISTIFISFGDIIRNQYLMPAEKDIIFIKFTLLGAVTNFITNLLLIPKYGCVGAAIGTVVAELFVLFYTLFSVKKVLPVWKYLKNTIPVILKSCIMLLAVILIGHIKLSTIKVIFVQVLFGIFIYIILNFKYFTHMLRGVIKYEKTSK